MAKTTQPPHLRIRIDQKMIEKLEKSRKNNGNTLTGEIISRLKSSFEDDDKIELVKEGYEKRIEDLQENIDRLWSVITPKQKSK